MATLIVGLLITMLFSAFFSGMEIAFVSSNRLLVEVDREKGGPASLAISVFYRDPSNFVSTMLVGNNIALVVYGLLFAKIFDATLFSGVESEEMRVTLDTILSTLVVLFTGEFLPKNIFKSNPNRMLNIFALPAFVCYVLLYPVSRFATFLARCFLWLLGQKMQTSDLDRGFKRVDLDYLVHTSIDNAPSDEAIEEEVRIFQNALDFSDTKVRDCMVPRTEIDAIDDTLDVDELRQKFIESGHSKVVVYHGDIDHIVGYIHSSELFKLRAGGDSPKVTPMVFVPESMAASNMLQMFLKQKKTLGIVVDEFGGTSGLISLEDIVEEIFGDIEDEHDSVNYVAKRLDSGDYMLSARLEIEKVNEMFDLSLPESDDYITIGGLILHAYQSFPKLNEIVKIGHFEFKIIKNTATKIELVRLKVL